METYKSKFGYHSIDLDTFVKIKKLHKAYWKTTRDLAKWKRWIRKQPENRIGPEPTYCSAFVATPKWIIGLTPKDVQQWGWRRYACDDRGVLEAYRIGRTPYGTPENTQSVKLSLTHIDFLLAELEKYEASKKAA